jgi:mono/diheme cytochrome c family protein
MCHQSNAAGLPGQYPRLAGRVEPIARTPDGRRYLALVVLNGLTGSIQVDGKPIVGFMPPFAMLKDQEVADTLNYLTTLQASGKKPALFTAAEIAKVRAEKRVPGSAVGAERQKLVAAKAIP